MRHVDPPDRPWGWQTHVLKKGRASLNHGPADHRNAERPSPFWLQYRDAIGSSWTFPRWNYGPQRVSRPTSETL
ncbi:MAG TPA: hypothetical protein QGF58_20350 [Myxococcota bacterium]|nr:hypothetical protein [Myxococcota bacterium]